MEPWSIPDKISPQPPAVFDYSKRTQASLLHHNILTYELVLGGKPGQMLLPVIY